jgi:large subunit ribosomal protein L25
MQPPPGAAARASRSALSPTALHHDPIAGAPMPPRRRHERFRTVADRPILAASPRTVTGKAVGRLRRQGVLPAVVYGHGVESEPIQMDLREFDTLRRHAGRNAIVDLQLDGARARPVIVHAVQINPVSRKTIHADLFVVRMSEEMTVDVSISFTGTSVAVDKLGGTLLHLMESVRVKALPDAIPSTLEVDITPMTTFDAMLHVRDIPVPAGVTLLTDPEEPLARVQAPRVEEEPVAAEAEVGEGAPAAEGAEGESAESESGGGASEG